MSHRVTTRTEIKDKTLAIQALNDAKMSFNDHGSTIAVTSGPMKGATIHLETGLIDGSFDVGLRDNDNSIGRLKRHYAEAKIKQMCVMRGITIKDRVVEKDGRIRLRCRGNFKTAQKQAIG